MQCWQASGQASPAQQQAWGAGQLALARLPSVDLRALAGCSRVSARRTSAALEMGRQIGGRAHHQRGIDAHRDELGACVQVHLRQRLVGHQQAGGLAGSAYGGNPV